MYRHIISNSKINNYTKKLIYYNIDIVKYKLVLLFEKSLIKA